MLLFPISRAEAALLDPIPDFDQPQVTRFAPSPTGYLHLGHAYSAWTAWQLARTSGGKMLLRIDDIDTTRCRDEYRQALIDDLDFLGLLPAGTPRLQSQHLDRYRMALDALEKEKLIYPCYLGRNELNALLSAPHQPPSNTDRLINPAEKKRRQNNETAPAWRLRMDAVRNKINTLNINDLIHGPITFNTNLVGDAVIARRDIGVSYHLATVIDDHDSGVTLVSRGADLLESTPIQRILQELLGLATPEYYHHQLLADEMGKRLAKRHDSLAIRAMRDNGMNRKQILHTMTKCPTVRLEKQRQHH